VPIERRAAPADQGGSFCCGAAAAAGVGDDGKLLGNDVGVHGRAPEARAGFSCCGDTGVDTFDDELPLLLGQGGEHVKPRRARRRRGVDPVRERSHMDPTATQELDGVEDVDESSPEAVDAPHDHGVANTGTTT
jgi:hypothetical protein